MLEERLKQILGSYGRLAVAFSGGIDSSFLLLKAREILGKENVLALIMDSELIKPSDTAHAISFAKQHDIWFELVVLKELQVEEICHYTVDSWYYSKLLMYHRMIERARHHQIEHLADGMIMDDLADVRPGMRARNELGIVSPLQEAGYYKTDIRKAAKGMEGVRWNQPSSCSVFSRFPYGSLITAEKVKQVMASEAFLEELGLVQVRVRHHGTLARIEVPKDQLDYAFDKRLEITKAFKDLGFVHVALDLVGYESGRMNAELEENHTT